MTAARSARPQANREVYRLLKDGVRVRVRRNEDADEGNNAEDERDETVRVIDWQTPEQNDFFLASQLWITGDVYTRRADLVGFVNGLPLVFVELKATHRRLKAAYDGNLRDYKSTIPQLFWFNAILLLSNGRETKVGSVTAGWEHFYEWKRINDEGEQGIVSLETVIRGVCEQTRLLDLVENFTLYRDAGGALVKLIARNHQYLGVNRALAAVRDLRENAGRLGVFWHTQGSGKSLSMVFFTQKVLRKQPGNWTFVVVTDRQELDDQIYKTYAEVGTVTESEAAIHAGSGEHLQRLLREDHRLVFTLIQKFHVEKGQTYPTLSERSDVIMLTDEAHRSQYDTLALHMRNALPRAAFLAFTGTPLLKEGEEKTRDVFGDYVSIYNFRQSVEDGTTVPLYYENRVPELQLTNIAFDEDMQRLLEDAALDEAQEKLLERQFAREYYLLTRDDRLEKIAEDLVTHFLGRGEQGKAMVVSIDKATAVRMYDKVRRHWQHTLSEMRARLRTASGLERERLAAQIAAMEQTDMAVVVSQAQNEVEDFRTRGLDIMPHRRRMLTEDLEKQFKDPADPLRIVFVCAMWMTGFDVPSLSTIYLDKPMRNHTLMQTIARANRVFAEKVNGLIVDYVGIFRNLQQALALYGSARDGATAEGELPIADKSELVRALTTALDETEGFCAEQGVNTAAMLTAEGFERVRRLDDAVDALVANDELKRRFLGLAAQVARLYRAILPDPTANAYSAHVALYAVLARQIRSLLPESDITDVMREIDTLLDESIAAEAYVIRGAESATGSGVRESGVGYDAPQRVDLSQIDFDALRAHFAASRKHTEAEKLRGSITSKVRQLVRLNHSRTSYAERLQQLIDEYNNGSMNVEIFFDKLVALAQELNAEEQRAVAEHLSEEELAIFDLLTRPGPELSAKEQEQVKRTARELLATLKHEQLVLDWRKRQQTRAQVRLTVQQVLDADLPRAYSPHLYEQKCDAIYQHIYEAYAGAGQSVYAAAG